MANFGETEKTIKKLFTETEEFEYEGIKYTVLKCGKPRPCKGECKTDVYVLTLDERGIQKEFKISVKQSDADFLENKITLERAIEILGEEAQDIIEESISKIRRVFEDDYLVYFNCYKKTEALCLKMGWKFEFINKLGGEKCGIIELTDQQKIDIYAGTNLSQDKKNCSVNGDVIRDSGVANYIINVDAPNMGLDYYLSIMQPIEDFAKEQDIYFACKAINYRCSKNREKKWDGNRPLAVYVNWKFDNEKLKGELIFEKPLSVRGDAIGQNIERILRSLAIDKNNFEDLKYHLHESVKTI